MGASLRNYWHPVAKADDVSRQPASVQLLDEKVVLFRTGSGISALKDLCIHRGTALSLGWIDDGKLACAYHGWQYDPTGRCVRIPSLPEGSPIPPKARTPAFRAVEAYDLVWVCLDDPVSPVPPFPDGFWDKDRYRTLLVYDAAWSTSAGRAIENFLDVSHFAWVHDGLLGTRDNTVTPRHEVEVDGSNIKYTIWPPLPTDLRGATDQGAGNHSYYSYLLHLPFTAHIEGGWDHRPGEHDYISMVASPISSNRTRVFCWRSRDHSFDESDDELAEFQRFVLLQDKAIVESQRPEEIPLDLRDELHLKVPDAGAISYRRLLRSLDHTGSYLP